MFRRPQTSETQPARSQARPRGLIPWGRSGELHSLPTLKRLTLKLPRCEGLTNVAGLGEDVCQSLRAYVHVSMCQSAYNCTHACQHLHLPQPTSIHYVIKGVSRQAALQQVSLDFSSCKALREATHLCSGGWWGRGGGWTRGKNEGNLELGKIDQTFERGGS